MEITLQSIHAFSEFIENVTVILGVPLGLISYWLGKQKEREDVANQTYDEMDNKYIEYQRLCLKYPKLDVGDVEQSKHVDLTSEEKNQELQMFWILFSIFERAFLRYKPGSWEVNQKQWAGWETLIKNYFRRNNCRVAWGLGGSLFDQDFVKYITDDIITITGTQARETGLGENPTARLQ